MARAAPPRRSRRWEVAYAVAAGAVCHLVFAAAVVAMVLVGWSGMTRALGTVAWPWSAVADAGLLLQFPLLHSWFLQRRGGEALSRLAPSILGRPLASTTYATIAGAQTLALYLLWTPSGVVWVRLDGPARALVGMLDAAAWLLLAKSVLDAGAALQTGALGWRAVVRGRPPAYPPMPTRGLFRHIRQPIYLAFALTQWTTPVWTPDQLAVAAALTGYCILGPRLKERRFARRHGASFEAYRLATPYMLPRLRRSRLGGSPAPAHVVEGAGDPPSVSIGDEAPVLKERGRAGGVMRPPRWRR